MLEEIHLKVSAIFTVCPQFIFSKSSYSSLNAPQTRHDKHLTFLILSPHNNPTRIYYFYCHFADESTGFREVKLPTVI